MKVGYAYWNQKLKFISFFDCLEIFVTESTNKSLIQYFWENNDTWHFNIKHKKYTIIIIVKYTIAHGVYFLFNITINIIKSISITHPSNFYCIITNNPQCIVLHLKWSAITGRFSKWVFLAFNRVNNIREIFEMG